MDITAFSLRLSQLRLLRGISARKMSLDLGKSNNYINTIENQKAYPTIEMFFKICDYLDVHPSEFFDPLNSDPYQERALLSMIHNLEPDLQDSVIGLIKQMSDHTNFTK